MARKYWTSEEVNQLRELYPSMPAKRVAIQMNRSFGSVEHKANKECIYRSGYYFSDEECALIRKLYPEGGIAAVMKAIGRRRSKQSIVTKAMRLGVSRRLES